MKIYQKSITTGENKILVDVIGYPLNIESAFVIPNEYPLKDSLVLCLKKYIGKISTYRYELIGQKLHDEFKEDMGVSGIEELVGRKVVGFIDKYGKITDGLGVIGDEK